MSSFLEVIKYLPVLIAALVLGNWFLTEVKKAKAQKKPWYAPYLSIPGVLILLALSLPIIIKIIYG